ncbi:hypothetical protein N6G96_06065 [Pediococcus inopinatus]|uniref:Phage protein n=1 Tax=Pediococcus inopinatus TaxID=114090 RepID=A0ABZ0Q1Q5_9LACO|nr:hypothetical protein [Pediococcus inopinatus]WPC20872.1 hypothetical protein N6G96_06065 [Pediococcus inopinatus]
MDKGNSRFEWLKEYQQLDRDIKYLKWNIAKTAAESSRWTTGDLANMHVGGKDSRPAKLEKEYNRLQEELEWREKTEKDLLNLINSFDGVENKILMKKYVNGETLEEMTYDDDMPYALSYIQKRHAELRRRLTWLDEWDENKYEDQIIGHMQLR